MTYTMDAYYKDSHGDEPVVVTRPEEVDALIDAMLHEPFANSTAALSIRETHSESSQSLRIGINPESRVGGLRYADPSGAWYAPGQVSPHDEVYYYMTGSDERWPRNSEVLLDNVRAAVKEFLASGGERPTCVEWAIWEQGMADAVDPNARFLVPTTVPSQPTRDPHRAQRLSFR